MVNVEWICSAVITFFIAAELGLSSLRKDVVSLGERSPGLEWNIWTPSFYSETVRWQSTGVHSSLAGSRGHPFDSLGLSAWDSWAPEANLLNGSAPAPLPGILIGCLSNINSFLFWANQMGVNWYFLAVISPSLSPAELSIFVYDYWLLKIILFLFSYFLKIYSFFLNIPIIKILYFYMFVYFLLYWHRSFNLHPRGIFYSVKLSPLVCFPSLRRLPWWEPQVSGIQTSPPWLGFWGPHSLALCPRVGYLTSLYFSFLAYKTGLLRGLNELNA